MDDKWGTAGAKTEMFSVCAQGCYKWLHPQCQRILFPNRKTKEKCIHQCGCDRTPNGAHPVLIWDQSRPSYIESQHWPQQNPGVPISPLICRSKSLCLCVRPSVCVCVCLQHVIHWPSTCHSSKWHLTQFSTDGLKDGERKQELMLTKCVFFGVKDSDTHFEEMKMGDFPVSCGQLCIFFLLIVR